MNQTFSNLIYLIFTSFFLFRSAITLIRENYLIYPQLGLTMRMPTSMTLIMGLRDGFKYLPQPKDTSKNPP